MSVDPIIVDPTNTQAINPYSYVMNNPLAYTDPSGYSAKVTEDTFIEQKVTVQVKNRITGASRNVEVTVTAKGNADGTLSVSVSGGSNGARSLVAGTIKSGAKAASGGDTTAIGGSGDIAQTSASPANSSRDPGVPVAIEATVKERILDAIDPSTTEASLGGGEINENGIRAFTVTANPSMALTAGEKAAVTAAMARGGLI